MSSIDPNFLKQAYNSLSDEDKEKYKQIGEYMYGDMSKMINGYDPLESYIAYVVSGLKSGLKFCDIEEDEKHALKAYYGKDWKKKVLEIINTPRVSDETDQDQR